MRAIVAVLLILSLTGCSMTRPEHPILCAVAGAVAGGASGAAIGSEVGDDKDTENDTVTGGAVGAGVGALLGYGICMLMPEEKPPAPPAPAPAPVAKPEPVVKKTVVLPGVHFAFDRADLKPEAKSILDTEVHSELVADSALTVRVEGHTDSVGTDSYNQSLSQRRADAVKAYLVSKGIDASRIETKGLGESAPVADNTTKEGRAKNRRVEIKVMQ